jgi:hypothetical protein
LRKNQTVPNKNNRNQHSTQKKEPKKKKQHQNNEANDNDNPPTYHPKMAYSDVLKKQLPSEYQSECFVVCQCETTIPDTMVRYRDLQIGTQEHPVEAP